eukprot:3604647-Pleurochrysis_carterae.AAC.1
MVALHTEYFEHPCAKSRHQRITESHKQALLRRGQRSCRERKAVRAMSGREIPVGTCSPITKSLRAYIACRRGAFCCSLPKRAAAGKGAKGPQG